MGSTRTLKGYKKKFSAQYMPSQPTLAHTLDRDKVGAPRFILSITLRVFGFENFEDP